MCKRSLPFLVLLVLSAAASFAQYTGNTTNHFKVYRELEDKNSAKGKSYKRMSWGVGTHRVDNMLELTFAPKGERKGTIKVPLRSVSSMAGFASTFNVLSQFSETTGLVFDYGLSVASWQFEYDSATYKTDHYTGTYSQDITMMTGAIPLSLDFKAGGEMSLCKQDRLLFTGGLGVAPWFGMNDMGLRFGAKPFVKLELGFHAGLAFKFRGMFYIGDGHFINDDGGGFGEALVKRKSTGNFGTTLGLAIMPFSWDWDKDRW